MQQILLLTNIILVDILVGSRCFVLVQGPLVFMYITNLGKLTAANR